MLRRCYLCGKPLGNTRLSDDHRMPMLLLDRVQPKVRGFAYGGKVQTHETCNNHFRPEKYGRKALQVIRVLYDPKCTKVIQSKSQENLAAYAVNQDCLTDFSANDRKFFRIATVAANGSLDPAHYFDRQNQNPLRLALSTALSVLAKSAAALLLDGHITESPSHWMISAIPFTGELTHRDLESVFPGRAPFDAEVSAASTPAR